MIELMTLLALLGVYGIGVLVFSVWWAIKNRDDF